MSETVVDTSQGGGGQDRNQRPTEDQVFEILSNRRRRYVFHYLKQRDREVYLREVAEQVAAWENDKSTRDLSSAETKRVKTALHQHHLPKMDDRGFVQYDATRETVQLDENVADLEVYLDVVPGADIPWSLYYLGLAGLGIVMLTGAWADLGPLASIPEFSCAAFIVVTLLVSATIHTYVTYSRLRLGGTEKPPGVSDK
ncbi:hypothetical protein [Haloarcula sp. Atlit-7R]|uniref:DUF7344 domain-containing protein n=1 Tax=Haloarcula sp. Atlit-7R TaxID=2282125 RepID=UPI000EF16AF4|nr:hypothetical protein [Haloarcula sp. Atlit-7R]RLN01390.1 hypothetical protein D3D01_00810 [Haloarcula sp. Atlit-7R]